MSHISYAVPQYSLVILSNTSPRVPSPIFKPILGCTDVSRLSPGLDPVTYLVCHLSLISLPDANLSTPCPTSRASLGYTCVSQLAVSWEPHLPILSPTVRLGLRPTDTTNERKKSTNPGLITDTNNIKGQGCILYPMKSTSPMEMFSNENCLDELQDTELRRTIISF